MPLFVLHLQNVVERPVEMVRDISYLLVELVQGVAYDPPEKAVPISTSKLCLQDGQVTLIIEVPSSLIFR